MRTRPYFPREHHVLDPEITTRKYVIGPNFGARLNSIYQTAAHGFNR